MNRVLCILFGVFACFSVSRASGYECRGSGVIAEGGTEQYSITVERAGDYIEPSPGVRSGLPVTVSVRYLVNTTPGAATPWAILWDRTRGFIEFDRYRGGYGFLMTFRKEVMQLVPAGMNMRGTLVGPRWTNPVLVTCPPISEFYPEDLEHVLTL